MLHRSPLFLPFISLILGALLPIQLSAPLLLFMLFLALHFLRTSALWKSFLTGLICSLSFLLYGVQLTHSVQISHPALPKKTTSWIVLDEIGRSDTVLWKAKGIGHFPTNRGWSEQKVSLLAFRPDSIYRELGAGDSVLIHGKARLMVHQKNPFQFDELAYFSKWDIQSEVQVQQVIEHRQGSSVISYRKQYSAIIGKAIEIVPSQRVKALLRAILSGDKSLIEKQDRSAFAKSGVMHLLAVSGLHVGLIAMLPLFLLKRSHRWGFRYLWLCAALLLIWSYTYATGASASTCRAASMLSIASFGFLWKRRSLGIDLLLATGLIMLILEPILLWDIGFQLSFSAVGGILLIGPGIKRSLDTFLPKFTRLNNAISVSVGAQLATTPFSIYYFGLLPLFFLPANLILIPVATLLLYLTVLHILLQLMEITIPWLVLSIDYLGRSIFSIAHFFAKLPYAAVETGQPSLLECSLIAVLVLTLISIKVSKTWIQWIRIVCFVGIVSLILLREDHRNALLFFEASHPEMLGYQNEQSTYRIQLKKYASTRSSYGWNRALSAQQVQLIQDTLIVLEGNVFWRKGEVISVDGLQIALDSNEYRTHCLRWTLDGRILSEQGHQLGSSQSEVCILRINSNGSVGTTHGLHRPPIP